MIKIAQETSTINLILDEDNDPSAREMHINMNKHRIPWV